MKIEPNLENTAIHVSSAILIFVALIIPAYQSLKLKHDLQKLTIMLSIFLFIHGLYHISNIFGFDFLGDGIFEPLSVFLLILFGLFIIKVRRSRQVLKR